MYLVGFNLLHWGFGVNARVVTCQGIVYFHDPKRLGRWIVGKLPVSSEMSGSIGVFDFDILILKIPRASRNPRICRMCFFKSTVFVKFPWKYPVLDKN